MGLDSFIFKISRPEHLDKECYSVKEIESLGLTSIALHSMAQGNKNNLHSCAKECSVENLYYDLEKIRAEYSLSENAYIGAFLGDGSIVVTDFTDSGDSTRVSISKEAIKGKFILRQTDRCYVFRREKVQQWYKNYPISNFFAMRVGPTENTVYYPVDEELASEFNDCFNENIPTKAMPEGTGLFYYEWF
ncbi:MAG: hypothetical protein Q3982_03085 [Phoenicibacter congonensis]|uniref:Uncharacterized protein n=1 Tax=Phoenicibacter congonensis TaxID=1944646 RepID=A0AA43RI48_9ACTN|nr:hypothetical protein [Phoenicibacter congonensis]